MMVKNTIFKIAVMIWPICGMVSSIKHRNDKILICDKGIESVFKPLHGGGKTDINTLEGDIAHRNNSKQNRGYAECLWQKGKL